MTHRPNDIVKKSRGALLGVLLALSSAAGAQTISDGEVRIGILTDLSGSGSVLAAQMAIDEFKASAKPALPESAPSNTLSKASVPSTHSR